MQDVIYVNYTITNYGTAAVALGPKNPPYLAVNIISDKRRYQI